MYKTVLLITESYYNVNSYFKYTQQLVQMGARNVSLLTAIYNLYRSTAYFQFLSAQWKYLDVSDGPCTSDAAQVGFTYKFTHYPSSC
jgi:hypothetical protein